MASIVRARADFNSGALVRLSDEIATSNGGQITYLATYCCLASAAARYGSTFRIGAQPPPPLSSKLSENNFTTTPTLIDTSSRTENGLVYFEASYATVAVADQGDGNSGSTFLAQLGITLPPNTNCTVTTEARSLSGEFGVLVVVGYEPIFSGAVSKRPVYETQYLPWQADYTSTTVTLESVSGSVPELDIQPSSLLSNFYNIIGYTEGIIRAQVIRSVQSSYTSGGLASESRSISGIYVNLTPPKNPADARQNPSAVE